MVFSVFSVCAAVTANAAETAVKVIINDVTRRYQDAKTFLDDLNTYRTGKNLTKWVMDSSLTEKAMVRAAELSIYASLNSPDGTSFLNDSIYDTGELIGYNVTNTNLLITNFTKDTFSNTVLNANYMNTVGVGFVEVRGKKYICVLVSNQKANEIDSSVLNQANVKIKQTIKIFPSLLKDCKCTYSDGQMVYCGTSVNLLVSAVNSTYSASSVYLAPATFNITSSDTSVFKVQSDNSVKALKPGTSTITMTIPGTSVKVSVKLEAISLKFANCTISDIPNQIYTGYAITPKPVITYDGSNLIEGSDYTLSYSNNVSYGTATVKITGINRYAGQNMSKTFKIVANTTNFVVASIVSEDAISVTQSLKISASSCNGKAPIKYTYSYTTKSSSTSKIISNSTSATSCIFTPTTSGLYYIKVSAVDNDGNTAYVNKTVTVQPKVTLNASLNSSTIIINQTQAIRASGVGGVTPLTYACYVKVPGSDSWSTIKDFSSTSSFTYQPTKEGTYTICVKCKSASGYVAKEYKEFTATKSTLQNKSYLQKEMIALGESVKLIGSASEGSGTYSFAYYYKLSSASSYSVAKSYSSSTSVTFTPKTAGVYDICIKAMDGSMTIVKSYFKLTVNDALKVDGKLSKSQINLNGSVTVSASASGGSKKYTYAFYYKRSSASTWAKKADFGTASSVSIKPLAATSYDICVKVKDSAGSVNVKYLTLKVNPQLADNSKLAVASITKGNTATVKTAATGGSGGYTYAVYYKESTSNSWINAQTFKAVSSVSFKPSKAATYDICVKVKDSLGYEAKSYLTLKVSELINNSTISSTSISKGGSVTVKAAASGGSGSYTYAVYYKKSTASSWSKAQDFGTNSSVAIKLSSTATYSICVKVKDSTGVITNKYFDVTVE